MGLALASEAASDDTRAEVLDALGVSYEALNEKFAQWFRSFVREKKRRQNKTVSQLQPTNSVCRRKDLAFRQGCLDILAKDFYCTSYSADFAGENDRANKAVRQFIKNNTNGLIDVDFELDEFTIFALINTLYLKDIWNEYGDNLPYASEQYAFRCSDGSEKQISMLQGGIVRAEYRKAKAIPIFIPPRRTAAN